MGRDKTEKSQMLTNKKRLVRTLVLLDASDCDPPHSLDLSAGSRDSQKVERLTFAFETDGFDINEPALVGYVIDGRVQLLTGTHRHEAARRSGVQLPVTIWLRSDVEGAWSTDDWQEIVRDIPVKELLASPYEDGPGKATAERVDPAFMYEEAQDQSFDVDPGDTQR